MCGNYQKPRLQQIAFPKGDLPLPLTQSGTVFNYITVTTAQGGRGGERRLAPVSPSLLSRHGGGGGEGAGAGACGRGGEPGSGRGGGDGIEVLVLVALYSR